MKWGSHMSIDVLQAKIRKLKNPTMVCICPSYSELPPALCDAARAEYGDTLRAAAEACGTFSCELLEALRDLVPAVSVETACFSALGADGVAVMQRVLRRAQECGYYVMLDMMRADIAPNAELLAASCFGSIAVAEQQFTPYPCDGVLLSSYLGSDAAKPFTRYCAEGKNVFLLTRSSNKSAREVQDLLSGDRVVYQVMADLAMRWSTDLFGANGYSQIGLAVGATNPQILARLRDKYDRLFFVVPGYGAQGAGAKDAQYAFDKFGHGAAIMAGRSILNAWQKTDDAENYISLAREAAEKMRRQLSSYVTVI